MIENIYSPDETNPHIASTFLSRFDEEGIFTFQTFDDCKIRKNPYLTRVLHGTLNEHCTELLRLNQQGAGIFFTVNATDGRGRSGTNIIKVRARGSIALKAALDAEYGVEKKDNNVTMTTTKMKEADIPEPISFLLKSIEIELVDEKKRPITSAILEPTSFVDLDLEKIRDIIPAEGINQTNLLAKMKTNFKISQNNAYNFLKKGVGKYWDTKSGLKNAIFYTPLFSFPDSNEHKTEKQTNIGDEND